jgi:uncharacterized membrane protein YhaH (DUF805 family)
MNWYKQALLHNYATFSGRARRKEYWYFALGNLLAVLIPSIAVGVRRLHDTGRSG